MATGPRPTPHPIVLHVNDQGNPVRLAESSSIYVTTLSAVTVCATNYLGLEVSGGVPGGDLSSLQFKTGNTTFNGSPFLKFSAQLSGLLANAVSASRIIASNLSATTLSATTYLNLPGTNLSSLLDVQYASVSGGQALIYSSSINKWAPGYTIYKSGASPTTSVGINGDIYLQYTNNTTNAAYLSSLLDTNINAVSNGQSLIWSSGYWIPSALPTQSPGVITSLPSASPIWNAASAEGYDIQFGVIDGLQPSPFDVLGFTFETPTRITNYRVSSAGPLLASQVNLSGLKDTGGLTEALTNSLIIKNSNGSWTPTRDPIVISLSATTVSSVNWLGLPSATPLWNANKISNLSATFTDLQPFDILGVGFPANSIVNYPISLAGQFLVGQTDLSALRDVDNDIAAVNNNTLVYINGFWTPSSSISLSNIRGTSLIAASADLSSVKLTKYVEPKSTVSIVTSSITLNLNTAQVFEISAISNISSITIQNADARSNITQGFTIIFSADGTQRTVTDWGTIKWPGGTGPTLTATNNKKDFLSFVSPDNGTNWYGFIGGQNF